MAWIWCWLWLWHSPMAAALIGPLAWELPCATRVVLKKKKNAPHYLLSCLESGKTLWSILWESLMSAAAHGACQINPAYFRFVLFCKRLLLFSLLAPLFNCYGVPACLGDYHINVWILSSCRGIVLLSRWYVRNTVAVVGRVGHSRHPAAL